MQSLDVISFNIWHILISLCNLVLLFLILKKFLYQPVRKVLDGRKAELDGQYRKAEEAQQEADRQKLLWEEKMMSAEEEAQRLSKDAAKRAEQRGDAVVAQAKEKAEEIVRQAEKQTVLERKRAAEEIRQEIVKVSSELTEKMLGREIKAEDHRDLIDSFIEGIGEEE